MTDHTSSSGQPENVTLAGVELLRIDHVGIAVADLDEAIRFYQENLGLRCVHQETNDEQGVREAMLAVGRRRRR